MLRLLTILGYMKTIKGFVGFSIPLQTLAASKEVAMTPGDVMAWRNRLPMADMGNTAKKIYQAISDCNKVNLEVKDRFDILELLRPPLQFVCQSLRRHYINQTGSLTPQQLTIANLAQTLQLEMANGYKLLIEHIDRTNLKSAHADILTTALERIIHYLSQALLRSYQLYSMAPKGLWQELHLVYQYAEKNRLLNHTPLENNYKRTLLLAAAYPYQWRQSEQDAIYTATEKWSVLATLGNEIPNVSQPGFLVIDCAEDAPPMSPARGLVQLPATCRVLDVGPLLNHLKDLLSTIEPNELQARIAHNNDVEYAIPSSVLKGLIKEWGTPIARQQERTPHSEPIKICIGLMATHYFVNNQHPFQPQSSASTDSFALDLPMVGLGGGTEETSMNNADGITISFSNDAQEKISSVPTYSCLLENENPTGYGLVWKEEVYPPMQAGELIGIEREKEGVRIWEIGKIRWLQHLAGNICKVGVERLAISAKAGAVQLIKEGQPAGYYLRCLLLGPTLLVPTLPFKSGSQVGVLIGNDSLSLELSKLVDATGSYKQFAYIRKQSSLQNEQPIDVKPTAIAPKIANASIESENKTESEEDQFGSVWSNL